MTGRNERLFEGSKIQCLVLLSSSGAWDLDGKFKEFASPSLTSRLECLGCLVTLC